jgi:hypothetical protein
MLPGFEVKAIGVGMLLLGFLFMKLFSGTRIIEGRDGNG